MSANKGLFAKYPNRTFIETGSLGGDGIQQALDEGFKVIYSIEITVEWFSHCVNRYINEPKVHMILGDSGKVFGALMSIIDEPVTFWLDAHESSATSTLLQELEVLKNHPIKTHSILIDDLRMWKRHKIGFDTEILKEKLLEINPNYKIKFEDGYKPNDILVAYV